MTLRVGVVERCPGLLAAFHWYVRRRRAHRRREGTVIEIRIVLGRGPRIDVHEGRLITNRPAGLRLRRVSVGEEDVHVDSPQGRRRAIFSDLFGIADLIVAVGLGIMTNPRDRARLARILELFFQDSSLNVYAGELKVRPPAAPTTCAAGRMSEGGGCSGRAPMTEEREGVALMFRDRRPKIASQASRRRCLTGSLACADAGLVR